MKLLSNSQDIDFGAYSLTNLGVFKAALNMNNNQITNVGAPTSDSDAVNRLYVTT
jgi:hypothetical protein